jgi:hypothetical protein
MCDKNTCGQESLSNAHLQTETTLAACRYPTSLPYSHGLPCLCRGRDLLSCRPVAALIWLRDCPRSRKSQPGAAHKTATQSKPTGWDCTLHACRQLGWTGGVSGGGGAGHPGHRTGDISRFLRFHTPSAAPKTLRKGPVTADALQDHRHSVRQSPLGSS